MKNTSQKEEIEHGARDHAKETDFKENNRNKIRGLSAAHEGLAAKLSRSWENVKTTP